MHVCAVVLFCVRVGLPFVRGALRAQTFGVLERLIHALAHAQVPVPQFSFIQQT